MTNEITEIVAWWHEGADFVFEVTVEEDGATVDLSSGYTFNGAIATAPGGTVWNNGSADIDYAGAMSITGSAAGVLRVFVPAASNTGFAGVYSEGWLTVQVDDGTDDLVWIEGRVIYKRSAIQ